MKIPAVSFKITPRIFTLFVFFIIGISITFLSFSICAGADTEIKAPIVDIQVILVKETIERGDTTQLEIIISNTSNTTLYNVSLSTTPRDFFQEYSPAIPDIAPFGSAYKTVIVKPGNTTSFMLYKLIAEIQYSWKSRNGEFVSAKVGSISIKIKRKYEDEMGGLLTGGAAALYFILPIYPAVAAFKLLEQKRKGEKLTAPVLGINNVIPGIIGAVLANLVVGVWLTKMQADILNIGTFVEVVVFSLVAGAIIPLTLWSIDEIRWKKWGFFEHDKEADILRKAILGPFASKTNEYEWVTLTKNNGESWTGLLLSKRKNTYVLSATFFVDTSRFDIDKVKTDIIDKGKVINATKLVEGIITNEFEIINNKLLRHIQNGKQTESSKILIKLVKDEKFRLDENKQNDNLVRLISKAV
jgi:hypothetical protein